MYVYEQKKLASHVILEIWCEKDHAPLTLAPFNVNIYNFGSLTPLVLRISISQWRNYLLLSYIINARANSIMPRMFVSVHHHSTITTQHQHRSHPNSKISFIHLHLQYYFNLYLINFSTHQPMDFIGYVHTRSLILIQIVHPPLNFYFKKLEWPKEFSLK